MSLIFHDTSVLAHISFLDNNALQETNQPRPIWCAPVPTAPQGLTKNMKANGSEHGGLARRVSQVTASLDHYLHLVLLDHMIKSTLRLGIRSGA